MQLAHRPGLDSDLGYRDRLRDLEGARVCDLHCAPSELPRGDLGERVCVRFRCRSEGRERRLLVVGRNC